MTKKLAKKQPTMSGPNKWALSRGLVLALVLVLSACGGSESAEPDPGESESSAGESGSGESGAEESSGETETEPADTTTTEAPVAIPDVEPIITGATEIVTTSPVEVEQLRPTLSWEPVEGAASYYLVVLDEFDEPYWVWEGSENETPVGGAEFSDFGVGPIIGVDYSWSVTAFDADGWFLAASGQLPVTYVG